MTSSNHTVIKITIFLNKFKNILQPLIRKTLVENITSRTIIKIRISHSTHIKIVPITEITVEIVDDAI